MDYVIGGEDLLKKAFSHLNILFIPSKDNDYRPRFLQSNILFYGVVLLLCIKIVTIGFFIPFPKNIFFADITKTDLLNLLNQSRENRGLNSLTDNNKLDQAALLKAQDMVKNNYFAHQSPQGITPWFWFRQVGYNYKYAGENLAIGFVDSSEVFNAWFNSPSHKDNLFNPNYKEVGTAILPGFGSNNATVVVQVFGSLQAKAVTTTTSKNVPQTITNKPQATIQPTPKATVNSVPNPVGEKVLGQEIQPETKINQLTDATTLKNNLYVSFVNFIVYDYQDLIMYVSYGLLLIVSLSLLLNILINFNIQRGQLIFKSILLIAILSGVVFLNKDLIIQMIPHQLVI